MFCRICGKQIENDSIYCKYCGSNNLNNIQPSDEEIQLKTNFNEASVSSISPKHKAKKTSIIIINLCFIIIVLLAIILFVPFKKYYIGVVANNIIESDAIEYHHLFNYPQEAKKTIWAKPPNSNWGEYNGMYNIFYLIYSIRFIILALIYILVRKNYKKINLKKLKFKALSLKNIILTLYIILLLLITIIFTPYVKFTYYSGKLLFTGERGFYPLFRFNDLMEITKNGNNYFVYNIDFRVLLLEVVVLTVIFLIVYLNIRKKTKY